MGISKFFVLSIPLLFAGMSAASESSIRRMDMNDEKTALATCYDKMYRYMIAKDTTSLGDLLDDAFVLVHMTGMRQPKNDYLRCIADGTLNYYSCEDTRLSMNVDGDTARMTGKSKVEAAVFGGGRHTWPLRLDMNLVKKGGLWLMTEAKASTY